MASNADRGTAELDQQHSVSTSRPPTPVHADSPDSDGKGDWIRAAMFGVRNEEAFRKAT